ncbi:MAG: fluoride efflux transporter CrcB [Bacteroidota bacterium]
MAVALGGAVGAMMRYGVALAVQRFVDGPAPVATWTVNLLGCLLIGFLVPFLKTGNVSVPVQLFVLTGFLGSLTTFSTFSMESVLLWQSGRVELLLLNVFGSVAAGLLLVWLGMKLHQALWPISG